MSELLNYVQFLQHLHTHSDTLLMYMYTIIIVAGPCDVNLTITLHTSRNFTAFLATKQLKTCPFVCLSYYHTAYNTLRKIMFKVELLRYINGKYKITQ